MDPHDALAFRGQRASRGRAGPVVVTQAETGIAAHPGPARLGLQHRHHARVEAGELGRDLTHGGSRRPSRGRPSRGRPSSPRSGSVCRPGSAGEPPPRSGRGRTGDPTGRDDSPTLGSILVLAPSLRRMSTAVERIFRIGSPNGRRPIAVRLCPGPLRTYLPRPPLKGGRGIGGAKNWRGPIPDRPPDQGGQLADRRTIQKKCFQSGL
jgi:hypothetical protein